MGRKLNLLSGSDCGSMSMTGGLRKVCLLLALIASTGIWIGNGLSTGSCRVERSTPRQDSSTGFPSSLQSETACFEQCIAPRHSRARL